jgi:sulfite reductase (NADPH) hemoprotein beta-component
MTIVLIDNGSLEPAATFNLRTVATQLSAAVGVHVHPISWKHSDRISLAALDGDAAAWTLLPWMAAQLAAGERDFVFIPFFISAQGAIGSALRQDLEKLQTPDTPFRFTFTASLASTDAIPRIVAARIRQTIDTAGLTLTPPPVIVVDHGGPSPLSAALRNQIADMVRLLLGSTVGPVVAASMEGDEHPHNHPVLADQLRAPGFNSGPVIIALLFLSPGRHAGPGGDIAQICGAAELENPALRCDLTELIGTHPFAADALALALRHTLSQLLPSETSMSDRPTSAPTASKPLVKNETIKSESNFLRGHILRDLADPTTGTITEDSSLLTKFHGIYPQDDRDLRNQRRKENKEKAFSFMARIRVPGGVCTPAQWLALDALADSHANGTLKITTRQAFQFHGILKGNLRPAIKAVNAQLMDTLAACGDVNRNVMANPNPDQSALHADVLRLAKAISDHLSPRTRAYHEIWVADELVAGGEPDHEPLYGTTYLPRKFKTVIAIPPSNDVDIYAHDLGFIAIADESGKKLLGFNVTVGGGLGMSHNQIETYPRLADILGFCTLDQVVDVAEKVMLVQRDYGDRTDRKHARLKYTIADRGIVWFRAEVEKRLGYFLGSPRRFEFNSTGDRYGWVEGEHGNAHYTLFIMSGRVKDALKHALREIATAHTGDFRLTANQNLMIAGVTPAQRPVIEALLKKHGLDTANSASGLALNAMSCVALPTCGLALAESERYLPELVKNLEAEIEAAGLRDDAITLRITGCPNGCGRPYLAEIGFVGRAPGKYNIYLGAAFNGSRCNTLFKASVPVAEIVPLLGPIIRRYALERTPGERFGDFTIRTGYVNHTGTPADFHEASKVAPAAAPALA